MIVKQQDLNKININHTKNILFYGINEGAKEEQINKLLEKVTKDNITNIDEKEILDNVNVFFNSIMSKSLFESEKIILINRATDKIFKVIEEIIERKVDDTVIFIKAGALDKKSKVRSLFEKNKELICTPFYPDTIGNLLRYAENFLRQRKIIISSANLNLIVNKCNGDRGVLKNELDKIYFFAQNNKKISTENILKLINLIENHSISELIDNCLAKNMKKTVTILNDNNFNNEDCVLIIRTFLNKSKRILKLISDYETNNNLDLTISSAKPPIFWKDKDIIKQQIYKWKLKNIQKLIYKLGDIELQIKRNINNSINLVTDFILEQSSTETNN